MIRLNATQLKSKLKFIHNYVNANNAATGSLVDSNSNITTKNIANLTAEINKDINIQIKRELISNKIETLFGIEYARNYIDQLESHLIYTHDESHFAPYCAAVSLYPFLLNGLQDLGGEAKAPKHLSSFNGGFTNLVFALASQFAGAVATVEYLLAFNHFATKDYGYNYLGGHEKLIKQEFQQVIYALNQPASARNYQCPFWNISIFDKAYYEAMFGNFVFPDGEKPDWYTFNKLQKFFLRWLNEERKKALLTFPIITASLLNNGENIIDKEYEDLISEGISNGHHFFTYTSDSVDTLSNCCRLKSDISSQINDFSYSLGAGGVQTGSMNVITLNMNRFIQNIINTEPYEEKRDLPIIQWLLKNQVQNLHKYQLAFKALYNEWESQGLLPALTHGFLPLDKMYLTIGINGLVEAAEYLGYTPNNNDEYKHFVSSLLKIIYDENRLLCSNTPGLKLNTEFVPGENLGTKFAAWDMKDGLVVPRDCYNSYLYPVEDEDISILDKFILHGKETTQYLDGGSALHLNLENYPTQETAKKLLKIAVKTGCNYFCFNVKVTICDDCTYINKNTFDWCIECKSKNVAHATRVIGYLRRVDNFALARQKEESDRFYHPIP